MNGQNSSLKITLLISELNSLSMLKSLINSKFPTAEIFKDFNFDSDLIIIDDRSFADYQKSIEKLKTAADNFIPLLLLKQKNTRLNKVIYDYLEDMIEIPASKNMLSLKIDNLLNIRNYWLKKDELEKKYYKIFDNISDLIFLFKVNKDSFELEDFCEVNQQTLNTLAYERQEFQNFNLQTVRQKTFKDQDFEKIMKEIKDNKELRLETILRNSKGESITVELKVQQIEEANQKLLLFLCRDISEEKKQKEEINYLLFHDKLTGIYNRRFFEEELQRLDSQRQLPLTIIMIDVNGLKQINDTFGHRAGDKLLKKTAIILKNALRQEDIVARLGGDEFAILLPRTFRQEAEAIAERIKESCSQSYIEGNEISVAIGISTKTDYAKDIEEVFKLADDRMYLDKIRCKNC